MSLSRLLITAAVSAVASASLAQPPSTGTSELDRRIAMARDRLTSGTAPTFTDEFILADVEPDEEIGKRRFDNFHGDLSGRYLSALTVLPRDQHPSHLPKLVEKIIAMQQPDGRFGRTSLQFTADQIDNEHMALLWGNGRLLVGLLDYYRAYPSDVVLESARKLGDFLLTVIEPCSSSEVAKRLEGRKAYGYICFTHLTEGLAMLATQAGEIKYATAARQIYPFLPERGTQHSHGYLATLRGVMLLYGQDEQSEDLAFVKKHFNALVESPDLMPFGGVNEYFGPFEDHKHQLRDEGCSEADFVELALQLWQVTGKSDYLQRAEFCLLNELSFNQFKSGDFGHHNLNSRVGYRLGDQQHKAWWCCTMHGLRLLKVAKDHVISRDRYAHYINLFIKHKYHDDQISLTLSQPNKDSTYYRVTVDKALDTTQALGIRTPEWAIDTRLILNGELTHGAKTSAGDYLMLNRVWKAGDILEIRQEYKLRLLADDGSEIDIQGTTGTVEGYLHYGPHLLAADGNMAEAFLSEPVDNTIHWGTQAHAFDKAPNTAQRPWAYLQYDYTHGGFPGTWKVVLRPMGELAFEDRTFLKARLKFSNAEPVYVNNDSVPDNLRFQKTTPVIRKGFSLRAAIEALKELSSAQGKAIPVILYEGSQTDSVTTNIARKAPRDTGFFNVFIWGSQPVEYAQKLKFKDLRNESITAAIDSSGRFRSTFLESDLLHIIDRELIDNQRWPLNRSLGANYDKLPETLSAAEMAKFLSQNCAIGIGQRYETSQTSFLKANMSPGTSVREIVIRLLRLQSQTERNEYSMQVAPVTEQDLTDETIETAVLRF